MQKAAKMHNWWGEAKQARSVAHCTALLACGFAPELGPGVAPGLVPGLVPGTGPGFVPGIAPRIAPGGWPVKGAKKFYRRASAAPVEGGHGVFLDERPLRSPAKAPFVVPSAELARLVAGEWDAQDERIDAGSMPLFGLAVTVVDRVMPQRAAIDDELRAYGGSDLLCYREGESAELAKRQDTLWNPWLDWARGELGSELVVCTGLMPVRQSDAAIEAIGRAIAGLDDWRAGMLHRATALSGSVVLGLAMVRGRLDAEGVFKAAFVDELWQAQKWGSDDEARQRRDGIRAELGDAERFLALLADGSGKPGRADDADRAVRGDKTAKTREGGAS